MNMAPTIAGSTFLKQCCYDNYGTTFNSANTRSFTINNLRGYDPSNIAQIDKNVGILVKDGLALAGAGFMSSQVSFRLRQQRLFAGAGR